MLVVRDEPVHEIREPEIEGAEKNRRERADTDEKQRMAHRRPSVRPHDVRKFRAHVL